MRGDKLVPRAAPTVTARERSQPGASRLARTLLGVLAALLRAGQLRDGDVVRGQGARCRGCPRSGGCSRGVHVGCAGPDKAWAQEGQPLLMPPPRDDDEADDEGVGGGEGQRPTGRSRGRSGRRAGASVVAQGGREPGGRRSGKPPSTCTRLRIRGGLHTAYAVNFAYTRHMSTRLLSTGSRAGNKASTSAGDRTRRHTCRRALATGSITKCPLSSKSHPHAHKVGRSPTRWVHNKPHGPSKCKGRAATGVATTTGR